MKNFAPPLINQKRSRSWKSFFIGDAAEQKHYEARHRDLDLYLLWIEAVQFGKPHCYPCVLDEKGDAMVFLSGNHTQNADMLKRWNLFVTPQNIEKEFQVTELGKSEFQTIYRKYQEVARDNLDRAAAGLAPDPEESSRFSELAGELDEPDELDEPEAAGTTEDDAQE